VEVFFASTAEGGMRMEQSEVGIAELIRDHARHVVAALRRSGVAASDAEDVAQEVFLAAHERLAGFESRSSLRAWLSGICRNKARDYQRKMRRRRDLLAARSHMPGSPESDPLTELVRSETAEYLRRALYQLPVAQRVVLVLHELEEMPMRDVAARLGCPIDTAYSRYRIASGKLRASLRRGPAQPFSGHLRYEADLPV
jgi:RNA polymerase sigma-70 factor (ECF subfamily)